VTCQEYEPIAVKTRPLVDMLKDFKCVCCGDLYKFTETSVDVVSRIIIGCTREPYCRNMRLLLPFTDCVMTNDSCQANELMSLLARHLTTKEYLLQDLKHVQCLQRVWSNFENKHPIKMLKPYSMKQVLLSKKKSKRRTYIKAYKSLQITPLERRDANIRMFVKNERMTVTNPYKPPRAIQARSARFTMCFQRYVLPYFEHIKNDVDEFYEKNYSPGMNQFEIADWLQYHWFRRGEPLAALLDHAEYDSNQHELWTRSCNEYMQKHFDDIELDRMCDKLINNKCNTKTGLKYQVHCTKCSGDGHTSSGNNTLNNALIEDFVDNIDNNHLVNGDDSVIIIEHYDLNKIQFSRLEEYGMFTKINFVHELEEIEFCQCHPVLVNDRWCMVRDPRRVLSRATVCINRSINTIALFRRWCRGVGECELSCNRGVPILMSFAKYMCRATSDKAIYDSDFEYHWYYGNMVETISESTRISFYRAFGISIRIQLELERYFDELTWDGVIHYVHEPTPPSTAIIQSNDFLL
jgi:hypothetical protein